MSLSPLQTATESSLSPLERRLVEVESLDTDLDEDFNSNVSRFAACLSYIIREIKELAISHPRAVGPRFRKFFRDTELEVIHHTILNAVVDEIQELLGCLSGNPWNLNDLKYDEETWHTMDHGCYLAIAEDPAAVLPAAFYVGSAFGITSSLYIRVSQHLRVNHRMRNPGNLLYSYIDGKMDVPRNVFVIALARFPPDMFEDSTTRQTYIELTETIFMALLGTIVSAGSNTYEVAAWQRLYPTRFPPKSFGCNQKSSIENWRGNEDRDATVTDIPKTPGARWSILKKRKIQARNVAQTPANDSITNRFSLSLGALTVPFPRGVIEVYGITAGDTVSTLVDIQQGLEPHAHAWANTDELPYEYRETANSLAIQLSGKAKKRHASIEVGQEFSIWLSYGPPVWEPVVKTNGYRRVNMAMTIIEWMLGEVIIPQPPSRLRILAANSSAMTEYRRNHTVPPPPKRFSMIGRTKEEEKERVWVQAPDALRRPAASSIVESGQLIETDDRTPIQREEDAERFARIDEQSYLKKKEKKNATNHAWYLRNKENIREKKKVQNDAWYLRNKENVKARSKAWRANNEDRFRASENRRNERTKEKRRAAREERSFGAEVQGVGDENDEVEDMDIRE